MKTTMSTLKMNKGRLILIMMLVASLISCVGNEKNKLDNRVKDYWIQKINKDYGEAYEFLSPGWRKNESKDSYVTRMNQSAVNWVSANVKEKKCSEKFLCTVTLDIEYEYNFKGSIGKKILVPTTIVEKWLMKENIWYHVPVKGKL